MWHGCMIQKKKLQWCGCTIQPLVFGVFFFMRQSTSMGILTVILALYDQYLLTKTCMGVRVMVILQPWLAITKMFK